MREIKFRAWNINSKKMIDLTKVTSFALDFFGLEVKSGVFIPFSDELIIMQYTGFKDKNGEEIYEGDILARENFYSWIVEWNCSGFCTHHAGDTGNERFPLLHTSEREIVGNIYENLELIL